MLLLLWFGFQVAGPEPLVGAQALRHGSRLRLVRAGEPEPAERPIERPTQPPVARRLPNPDRLLGPLVEQRPVTGDHRHVPGSGDGSQRLPLVIARGRTSALLRRRPAARRSPQGACLARRPSHLPLCCEIAPPPPAAPGSRRAVERLLTVPLSLRILLANIPENGEVHVSAVNGKLEIDIREPKTCDEAEQGVEETVEDAEVSAG